MQCRELKEESGLTGHDLDEIGLLKFEFQGDPVLLEVHVFSTTKYSGQPIESDGRCIMCVRGGSGGGGADFN